MPSELTSDLDKQQVAATFEKAAANYEQHDFLQRQIAERALERLDLMTLRASLIADIGSGTGRCARALAARYRRATVLQCDIAWAMLNQARDHARKLFSRHRYVCGDVERLPLKADAFDLAFSNLSLQWCLDLGQAFAEIQRILHAEGLLLFTTLGPDTLKELRQAWAQASDAPHINRFFDMHDVGDALVHNGFTEPVMETEHITVNYDDVLTLMRDLKGLGASNAARERARGLLGKRILRALIDAYEAFRVDGKLPATYEVIYGHAWATEGLSVQAAGEHTFPLERLRRR